MSAGAEVRLDNALRTCEAFQGEMTKTKHSSELKRQQALLYHDSAMRAMISETTNDRELVSVTVNAELNRWYSSHL